MTSSAFSAIDLSTLAAPDAIDELSVSAILANYVDYMKALDSTFTAFVESDPIYKLLETTAYREVLLRQKINEKVNAVMLAYATGTTLDQLGANYNVTRLTITAADNTTTPPTEAVMESDDNFRARIQLAFEGLSTAGSTGAYIYHTKSADSSVADANAVSPSPGHVTVYVMSSSGNGEASEELIAAVNDYLSAESRRPLTDNLTVQSASIIEYTIAVELTILPGPDSSVVKAAAEAILAAYANLQHRIGYDVTLALIYASACQSGVQNATITSPAADVVVSSGQASYCTGITVTIASSTNV